MGLDVGVPREDGGGEDSWLRIEDVLLQLRVRVRVRVRVRARKR